jgi:dipeptidyl aminopeptidase B
MGSNEAAEPLVGTGGRRRSHDSDLSSASTTSLVFERIHDRLAQEKGIAQQQLSTQVGVKHKPNGNGNGAAYVDDDRLGTFDDDDPLKDEASSDLETGPFLSHGADTDTENGPPGKQRMRDNGAKPMDRKMRWIVVGVGSIMTLIWLAALAAYVINKSYAHASTNPHDPQATASRGSGKDVTLDQILSGYWRPNRQSISWIEGPDGEDGLLLERDVQGKGYLVVEDVRGKKSAEEVQSETQSGDGSGGSVVIDLHSSRTLMQNSSFDYGGRIYRPESAVPSRDLQRVLLGTGIESNWRHSSTATYWLFDVRDQKAVPLIPDEPEARVQLATWSPTSDAVVFTRGDNNMYLRHVGFDKVTQITHDGGPELFNGVPDWVYEEEVLGGASATWWSGDGRYIAFLRTNETGVPDYPVQYFIDRPSGKVPPKGEENYPETRLIKYPKAGAHNPVVNVFFYDVDRGDVFPVNIEGGFADDDRLITTMVWCGNHVIIKETNRVSDVMRVDLVDVVARTGKAVRTVDVGKIDGGWFEISQKTRYVPADVQKGRKDDGYIDTIVYNDGDHLAYFTPLDNPTPVMLTGAAKNEKWEVVEAPSAVDLERNLVYFVATKESSIQRHIYTVNLAGEQLTPFTDTTVEGYYTASFSSGAGYALLNYNGPNIPTQKVVSTPSNPTPYSHVVEANDGLSDKARKHELPLLKYGTITIDGNKLNYVERRPPHFDERKRYPVIFQQYSGPGSQSVSKAFAVDYQSYLAAGLGYICVTVDGRGTGYIGRKARVIVRGQLGKYEAHDQIAAAKHWGQKSYVDDTRLAIWGWSYGGFNTLKTLEIDGGRTFSYGMAVAPVTDWRLYDSVYTERYMLTPQTNQQGYDASAISNATALGQNVRFLLMHGTGDDNVHFQNSLRLLDDLDQQGVENYDVQVFPDSDHGIYFHGANRIVYDSELLLFFFFRLSIGAWLRLT